MNKEQQDKKEKSIHQLFEIGIILKGINAALEIVLGLLLVFFNVGFIVQTLIDNALVDDPDNFIARHLQPIAATVTPGAEFYGSIYLLGHGLVKVVLVWGLLRDRLWAYPAALGVLALFVLYQTVRILQHHSIPLMILTAFDLALIGLIFHEYRRKYPRVR